MVRRNFKIGGIDTSNVNISANGFATTLTANATLASNVSFSLPGADGNSGQVLATDGGGNLFFTDSSTSIDLVQDNVDVVGASLDSFGLYANSTFALSNEAVTFADLEVANLVVEGDMTIIGDTTTIESNNVVITNPYLLLNNGISGANTLDAGIVIDRGSSSNVGLIWDEDSDSFTFITTDDGIEQTELTPTGNASVVVGGLKINSTAIDLETNSPVDGQPLVYVAANDAFETGTAAASNTQVYVGDTLVSNTAVILEAGNGISLSSNADSGIVTFSTAMGNVTSQVIAVDGTANSFTMSKASANSNMLLVFYNGLALDHEEYAVSGTTLTLSNVDPLIADSKLQVRHFDFFDVAGVVESGADGGYSFQGENFGYVSGGLSSFSRNTIDKFSFSSDANASDVGDITQSRYGLSGQSSTVFGYSSGGNSSSLPDTIDKFPFSSDSNSVDVGNLTQGRYAATGQSSTVFGYASGGFDSGRVNTIDKFPFSSDANATDVGDLTQIRYGIAGQSSTDFGYASGGTVPGNVNTIDKFPFSSDSNATDVGDLTQVRQAATGQSSTESGYSSGGAAPGLSNTIDKFPFSSDTNATDVGNLTQSRRFASGQSSIASGYTAGGAAPSTVTTIDKFPFSSDTNGTDVGDLTQNRYLSAGQQY